MSNTSSTSAISQMIQFLLSLWEFPTPNEVHLLSVSHSVPAVILVIPNATQG